MRILNSFTGYLWVFGACICKFQLQFTQENRFGYMWLNTHMETNRLIIFVYVYQFSFDKHEMSPFLASECIDQRMTLQIFEMFVYYAYYLNL